MKKLLFSSFALASIAVFAYTQTDVDNATYLAGKGIITTQSTTAGYRLDNTITRAEVAGIALKLRGTKLPEGYTCKKYFSDTIKNDWICRAAELAADQWLISRNNKTFRPQDRITRAEALAMMMHGIENKSTSYQDFSNYIDANEWQIGLIQKARSMNIINPDVVFGKELTGMLEGFKEQMIYFYPNRNATRAEVFGFAKNILEYKATMSGEVTIQ